MPMPPRTELLTRRLVLVPQTLAATRALVEGTDPGLVLAEGYPHADTLDGLRLAAAGGGEDGGWFITVREPDAANGSQQIGSVIGDCGTKGWVDEAGQVEIGYGLAAPWRGRGFGTEAVEALVGWLLLQPDVRRVVAEVELGNSASRRLLERLGFAVREIRGAACWFELSRDS